MKSNSDDELREPSYYHAKIKDWPTGERPREKLIARGAAALSDAELLAILIHSGSKKITALDLAKTLLQRDDSFVALSKRTVTELAKPKGMGPARAVTIAAALEIGRRMRTASPLESIVVRSPEDVAAEFIPRMRGAVQEIFFVLLLNNSGRLIRDVELTRGTVNASLVHPREVFRHAVIELATSIILLHNHPGGTLEPSPEDIAITRQLVDVGKVMDIPVHDHIIICGDEYFSFAERGYL